jgi:hypothetical protein
MPRKKKDKGNWDLEPQKSSAAQFLTYVASTGAGGEKYEIRYADENIWMSQKMLASVYGVEVPNIAYHLRKLFADAELDKGTSVKGFLIDVGDGRKFAVNHYNLQVIIALGFKIDNEKAIAFRKWANQIVAEYTIKGWVMDVPRLKDGSPISDKYFENQLERIREIRMSERKFYQKITDLYATAIDYDKTSNMTRVFYATVQNRMHCAVHGHTAAEILYTRADANKEHMGLTSWEDGPDGKIRKSDVVIAKNYLTDDELGILERMVNAFLEYAETQTLRKIPLTMADWKTRLEKFLELFDQHAPRYAGDPVTAFQAQLHAESEFEKYRIVQDKLFLSDYDRYLLALEEEAKKMNGGKPK